MSTSYEGSVDRIPSLIEVLNSTFSSTDEDRILARETIVDLYDLTRTEDGVKYAVENGVIPVLVKQLKAPSPTREANHHQRSVEMASALMLRKLAKGYLQLIVDAGAIPPLVELLKRHTKNRTTELLMKAVLNAIRELVMKTSKTPNQDSQNLIRTKGGIPPLVELLRSTNIDVKLAAARVIVELNIDNRDQIVELKALPNLVSMMMSENVKLHHEAMVVTNLLANESSILDIKKRILDAGALQPVIRLLRSPCSDTRIGAVMLLNDFVISDPNYKKHIAQRGALPPLIGLLTDPEDDLKDLSIIALTNLAKDETHIQVGIVEFGGLVPFLDFLKLKPEDEEYHPRMQRVLLTLFRLAKNEDNVVDIVREDAVPILLDSKLQLLAGATDEFLQLISNTLRRLELNLNGWVLESLSEIMRFGEERIRTRVVLALAHLCSPNDHKSIFIHKEGLPLLLDLLTSGERLIRSKSARALLKLANRATPVSPVDAAILSSPPQMYVGEQYVNNSARCDVTFLVEGKEFYAHKESLMASSAVFRALFSGDYKEKDGKPITIPNIGWNAFEGMMRYIHTGSTMVVGFKVALELLGAADQYFVEGLKCWCEDVIGKGLCFENLEEVLELASKYNSLSLKQSSVLFLLENYDKLDSYPWCNAVIDEHIRSVFLGLLWKDANTVGGGRLHA